MNIRVESPGPCRREVHIEVPADKVRAVFEEVTGAYAAHARIPGFRPGRAPIEVVRRRYQKEIVGDVKERLIPEAFQAAVKQEKLNTVAVLDVKEQPFDAAHPFAFSVLVDVAPDFRLPEYKGIALQRRAPKVEEQDIDAVLTNMRERSARFEEVEGRPVQLGDLVLIDYEGVSEGRPIKEIAPSAKGLGQGSDFWMMADEKEQFIPGFAEGLVGASVGERREVRVDFPQDFEEPAIAGKKATYFVTIKAVRERKLPALDAEFLKSVGAESIDDLRMRIREDFLRFRERNETLRLESEIVRHLLDNAAFDVPQSVLEEETQQTVYDIVRDNQQRGVSVEQIEAHKDELISSATQSASERVKLRYILQRIAAEENIIVEEQELESAIRALAQSWGVSAGWLRSDLEKRDKIKHIRYNILSKKVLARLLEQAVITTTGDAA